MVELTCYDIKRVCPFLLLNNSGDPPTCSLTLDLSLGKGSEKLIISCVSWWHWLPATFGRFSLICPQDLPV